jgi:CheY-like chemotaxis protein
MLPEIGSTALDVAALVIEPNLESARLVQAVLEPWGVAVITTSSTAEAQLLVAAVRPDIVLCDLHPPLAEGLRFIQWLRSSADGHLRHIPAIATTAAYEDIDARSARGAGFDVFLRKPIDPDQLPHTVAFLLAQSRAGGAGQDGTTDIKQ